MPGEVAAARTDRLDGLVRGGVRWALVQVVLMRVLGLGTSMVLARLLSEHDYGMVAQATTLTALLQTVGNFGLGAAAIQRASLKKAQVDNLFWVSAGLGVLLWCVCVMMGPALAWFYRQPELVAVSALLGVTFVFDGLALQPAAILTRQLRTRAVSLVELSAQLVAVVSALVAGLWGAEYWALVVHVVVAQGVRMVGMWMASKYRPARFTPGQGTVMFLRFGAGITLTSLMFYLSRNLDNILIGRVWGSGELGFYNRAYFLMTLPATLFVQGMGNVFWPALSSLQSDMAAFRAMYGRVTRQMGAVGVPVAIGLGAVAPEVVRLVYGAKWGVSAGILQWLSLASVLQITSNTFQWLFLAKGQSRPMFVVGLTQTVVFALAFWVGVHGFTLPLPLPLPLPLLESQNGVWVLPGGGLGVAQAYAVANVLIFFPTVWMSHRAAEVSVRQTLGAMVPIWMNAGAMGLVVWWLGIQLIGQGIHWVWVLIAKVSVGVVFYGIAVLVWMPRTRGALSMLLKRGDVSLGEDEPSAKRRR